jgi:sugar phosphate permease
MATKTFRRSMLLSWIICSLGAVFYCYEYFLRITPGVISSELMNAYNLKGGEFGNFSALYYHAYVPMQIAVGLMMDRFGPRRLLTFACFLCAIGTYLFAGPFGYGFAQFGRFIVGFGSAFAFVGALKLATIWLPPNRFALVSGIIMCLGMTGAMVGDVLLREMIDAIGWRTTIYVSAIAGLVLTVILWLVVRDSSPEHPDHHTHVIDTKTVLKGLGAALMNPQIWLVGLVGFFLYLSLSAFAELWGIPYLEQAHGLSKTYAAYANSMVFLGWAVGSPIWGWFSDFIQSRCMPLMIGTVSSLALVCVLLYVPHLPVPLIFVVLFLFGLLSSAQILVFAISHEVSKMKIAGTAIALTNMILMIGGNIFQPVIGLLLDSKWTDHMIDGARVYSVHAYQFALSVIPAGLVLTIIVILFLRETHCSMDDVPEH